MDSDVMFQIARLEKQQLRPMRELAIDPNSTDAQQRLQAIDEQIATLRESLSTSGDAPG